MQYTPEQHGVLFALDRDVSKCIGLISVRWHGTCVSAVHVTLIWEKDRDV